jgi:hypothetical protein
MRLKNACGCCKRDTDQKCQRKTDPLCPQIHAGIMRQKSTDEIRPFHSKPSRGLLSAMAMFRQFVCGGSFPVATTLIEPAVVDGDYFERRIGSRTGFPPRHTGSNGVSLPFAPYLCSRCSSDCALDCASEKFVIVAKQLGLALDSGVMAC